VNPLVVIRSLPGEIRQRAGREQYGAAEIDESWEEHLHMLLGAPWPCPDLAQLTKIMADIGALLAARGLAEGRYTYAWYSDAEGALCRAAWCTAMHGRPDAVVETGVAHGVTTRIILEALRRSGRGRLWSVDLPFPFDHRLHSETAIAVTEEFRPRWTYVEGTSRRRLPGVLAGSGPVGMFIHDSLHTARNTLFEMEQIAKVMPVGGIMLVDDIGSHDGFATFAKRHLEYRTIVAPSDDRVGLFGIAVHQAD